MQPDLGLRVRRRSNKPCVVLLLEWHRRASFALPVGCCSEGEARAVRRRVCGISAPGRPWWQGGAALQFTASSSGVGA
jgi:hypothetical protein